MQKLRDWLKLPTGPWPPDHYALIGLAPGAGTSAEIEGRILERLELLRRYQLPHPDEATEGMNLLARALDTLTDPEARRAYDARIGAARRKTEVHSLFDSKLFDSLFPGVPLAPTTPIEPSPADEEVVETSEPILPDVILLPDVEDEPDVDDDPEFIAESGGSRDVEFPDAILVPLLPAAARLENDRPAPRRTSNRHRAVYADLARVRKALRVLDRARPYLVDSERTFARRTDSLALMGLLAELRPILPTVNDLIGTPNRPGGIVAALVRQRLVFDTFRSLLPGQREALAKDFRAAHYRLAEYYDDLRDAVRRRTTKGWDRRVLGPALRHLADYPEWLYVPLGVLVLIVAAIRSV